MTTPRHAARLVSAPAAAEPPMKPLAPPSPAREPVAQTPLRPRSIVALADLSEASDAALNRAAEIATAHGAALRVLHFSEERADPAVDPVPRLRWKARRLARLHGWPVEVADAPVSRISALREALGDADLVVTHRRPARGWAAAWRGDGAARIVARLPLPVLVVKTPCRPYAGVVAAVEVQDQPERVARWACALAGSAPVTLLHVVQAVDPGKLRRAGAEPGRLVDTRLEQTLARRAAQLQRVVRALAAGGDGVTAALAVGERVVDEILLRQPAERGALVVLGRATDAPWLDALLGSVAHRVLRAWAQDVLVVPVRANLGCAEPVDPADRGLREERLDGTTG